MDRVYIYGLKSIDNNTIMYVGKTINPSERLKQHRDNRSKNKLLSNWISNNTIEMIIIEKCFKYNWEEREKYWISFYGLQNLLNIHEGGEIYYGYKKFVKTTNDKDIYEKITLVENNGSIFNKLVEQRIKFGISQKKMADHLGITKSTMNRYEKGSREISLANAEKYADKLGYELKLIVK